ncbi:MAG TPA: hypothetical protein VL137_08170 [Polyangiaceae bacterium]|nr:hypothetical protein [Polyangiaceae bacterium]
MEEQRQNSGGHRRRRRSKSSRRTSTNAAPVLIAARRPDSPLLNKPGRHNVAASAEPSRNANGSDPTAARALSVNGGASGNGTGGTGGTGAGAAQTSNGLASGTGFSETANSAPRRSARIVQTSAPALDDRERLRLRLLERLAGAEGRHTISKVADEIWANGFSVPAEQEFQVQLLEQFDEARVRDAMAVLSQLLSNGPPLKRAVFEQRLRRLEENADETSTREAARALRRQIRS